MAQGAVRGTWDVRPGGDRCVHRLCGVRSFHRAYPAFLDEILGLSNLALAGVVVFGQFAACVVSQFVLQRMPSRHALLAGCAGLIAGAVLVIGALTASSLALLVAGVVVAGFGQGLSFGAGLATLNAESPAQQRGEVTSSFFVVA